MTFFSKPSLHKVIPSLLILFSFHFISAQDSTPTARQDGDAALLATTNLLIESDSTTNILGWTRQAVQSDGKGGVIDRSGTVVGYIEMAAQRSLATNIQSISYSALNSMTNSVKGLWDVTNQIPNHAEHVALFFPRSKTPLNLTGEVIEEGTDGTVDYQVVKYSQYLSIPPKRHIKYTYLNTTATVQCVWDKWNPSNLTHRCTFAKPNIFKNYIILSYRHEKIGGDKGFDFGSALITVDGTPTYTGVWTNKLNGSIYTFRNGAHIKTTREGTEQ